jgi:leader peptidase (prepilin peptidase)/N-methyltransferase
LGDLFFPIINLLQAESALFTGLALILGMMIGSFLNVVIHRLPRMVEQDWLTQCAWAKGEELPPAPRYNLAHPASQCPACQSPIRWHQNIPVLSWLLLRGRCAACQAPISPRYPVVEAATGLLFAYTAWRWGLSPQTLTAWGLLAALLALAAIDLDTFLLPDDLTLPLLWAGLLVNIWGVFAPLEQAVVGAIAGYLSLWLVFQLFKLLTGKEGMGYGDFKLLAALGAWLGWKMLLPIVLAASFLGAVAGISLILLGRQGRERPIPFGPWLALGGVLALFWGEGWVIWWLGV